jgi:hypothetical protein
MKSILNIFFITVFLINTSSIAFSQNRKLVTEIDDLEFKPNADFTLNESIQQIYVDNDVTKNYIDILYIKTVENSTINFKTEVHESIHKTLTVALSLASKGNLSFAQAFDTKILTSLFELEYNINLGVHSDRERLEKFYTEFQDLVSESISKIKISSNIEKQRMINYFYHLIKQLDYSNPLSSKKIKEIQSQAKIALYAIKTIGAIFITMVVVIGTLVASSYFPEYKDILTSGKFYLSVFALSYLPSLKRVFQTPNFNFKIFINEFKSKDFSINRFLKVNSMTFSKANKKMSFEQSKKVKDDNFSPLDLGQLKGLLVSDFPLLSGSNEFINNENHLQINSEHYDALIDSDPDLLDRVKSGKQFRESFLRDLVKQFPGTSIDQIIDPEAELLKRLKHINNRNLKPQNLTEQEVEKLALARVIDEYMLDSSTTLSDLLHLSQSDSYFEHIVGEYNKYKFYFYDDLKSESTVTKPELIKLLNDYNTQSIKMRKINFYNFISALGTKGIESISFQSLTGTKKIDLSFFEKAELQFFSNRSNEATYSYKTSWMKSQIKNLKLFFTANSSFSFDGDYKELYLSSYKPPVNPNNLISFRLGDELILISEADFNQMIYDLSYEFEKYSSKDNSRVYQREFYFHDKELSNFIKLLENLKTVELEYATNILEKKIQSRKINELSFFASSLISSSRAFIKSANGKKIEDLIWCGFKKHPSYWLYRSKLAKELNLNSYKTNLKSEEFSVEQKRIKLNQVIQNLKNKHRMSSSSAKSTYVISFVVAMGMMIYSIPYTIGMTLDLIESNSKHDVRKNSGKGSSSGGSDLDTKMEKQNTNHSLDKLKGDQSPYPIFNIYTVQSVSGKKPNVPNFFGIFTDYLVPDIDNVEKKSNYTSSSDLEKVVASRDSKEMYKEGYIEVSKYSFKLTANSRYSIPVPVGYKLASLIIQSSSIDDGIAEFETYRHKKTGLYYIKTLQDSQHSLGFFDISARFVLDHNRKDNLSVQISSTDLKKLSSEYDSIGATELRDKLSTIYTKSQPISLTQFSDILKYSGLYTYDIEKMIYLPSFSDFSEYKKYIKNGYMFYQCSGSNNLLTDSLNYIFKIKNINYKAYPVSGFVYDSAQPNGLYADKGHMTTYASSLDYSYSFVKLDATPLKTDPKYADKEDSHPLKEEIKDKEKKEIKDSSKTNNKYVASHEVGPIKSDKLGNNNPSERTTLNSRPPILMPRRNEVKLDYSVRINERKELEKKEKISQLWLTQLNESRTSLHAILAKLSDGKSSDQLGEMSGLKAMTILPLFMQYLNGDFEIKHLIEEILLKFYGYTKSNMNSTKKEFIKQTLSQIYSQNQNNPDEVLRYLLSNIQAEYRKNLSKAQGLKNNEKKISPTYSHLLNEDLQRELSEAFRILFSVTGASTKILSCKSLFN